MEDSLRRAGIGWEYVQLFKQTRPRLRVLPRRHQCVCNDQEAVGEARRDVNLCPPRYYHPGQAGQVFHHREDLVLPPVADGRANLVG